MSDQVPTLDLREFGADRERFVAKVGAAYREFGFCGFSNHGIDDELIRRSFDMFRRFFKLPLAVKQRYKVPGGAGQRGYTGFGVEVARDSDHPDLKEFWHIGRELPEEHRYRSIMLENVWPSEVPEMREIGYAMYQALDRLGHRVLSAIALHLGQHEDYFDDKIDSGNSILRAIHYPPLESTDTPSVRAARHEDINLITLLVGSNEPGLEILRRDGAWIPVTMLPGVIVINIGDMLQRLTNHVLPSTTHRVLNPTGEAARRERYSMPFFLHPNPDFMIETLSSCVSEQHPNRYPEPLMTADFLRQRLAEIGLLEGVRPRGSGSFAGVSENDR